MLQTKLHNLAHVLNSVAVRFECDEIDRISDQMRLAIANHEWSQLNHLVGDCYRALAENYENEGDVIVADQIGFLLYEIDHNLMLLMAN